MKTLIVYDSKHGAAEKCAQSLLKLMGQSEAFNLSGSLTPPDLKNYEALILGSPVYAGRIRKKLKKFAAAHEGELKTKKTGIFLCSLTPEEQTRAFFEKNFPAFLLEKSKTAFFGGALSFNRMNFIERFMIQKITGYQTDHDGIHQERIEEFARHFQ